MSDRRSHWSDKLVDAVGAEIERYITVDTLNPQFAYAVIAAVEDWLTPLILDVAVGQTRRAITSELRAQTAEAQIQAVRELIDKADAAQCGAEVTAMTVTTDQVRSALDGAMMSSDLSHVPPKRTRVDPTAEWRERTERAEDTIQRVRERAGGPIPAVHGDWMAGYAAAMRDILSALDGERDE